jgi:hypothetical protein
MTFLDNFFGRASAPKLEDVAFPDQHEASKPQADMVIDFGTTASVVALVNDIPFLTGEVQVRLELLAGNKEHSSDMSINSNGQVISVGSKAFSDGLQPGNRYYTSLKRYLEMGSRGGIQSIDFADIVSGFLQESIREPYRSLHNRIGKSSRIVISVPNSFNPTAVEKVRQGVIRAIAALSGNDPAADIDAHNIRVVRESEAVAYLYRRGSLLTKAPTLEDSEPAAAFAWKPIQPSGKKHAASDRDSERIIVLDIGGGTTDLSVVSMIGPQRKDGSREANLRVVMNVGLAVGGTDVDKLLLRAAIDPGITTPQQLESLGKDLRAPLLKLIRDEKHKNAEQFFTAPPDRGEDELPKTLAQILDKLPGNLKGGAGVSGGEADPATVSVFRREARKRLNRLIQISITGLFDLVPDLVKKGVTKILLTGRGSQLLQIQAAVIAEAAKLGAEVLSLTHPYHLKLAVAYGCALVREDEFSGARLPSGTFGRHLQVSSQSNSPFAEFTGDFPVSGDAPTVFDVTCTCNEKQRMRYDLWEYRTVLSREFLNEDSLTNDQLLWMGCSRPVITWEVPRLEAGDPYFPVKIAWHPASEEYYSIVRQNDLLQWSKPDPTSFDLKGINFITGLPLGFPHEV